MTLFGGGLFEFNYTLLFAMLQIGLLSFSLSTVFFGPIAKRLIDRKEAFFCLVGQISVQLSSGVYRTQESSLWLHSASLRELDSLDNELYELYSNYDKFNVTFGKEVKHIPYYYTNELAKWRLLYLLKDRLRHLLYPHTRIHGELSPEYTEAPNLCQLGATLKNDLACNGNFSELLILKNQVKAKWLNVLESTCLDEASTVS